MMPEPYVVGCLTPLPLWEALVILAAYALVLGPLVLAAWVVEAVDNARWRWVEP